MKYVAVIPCKGTRTGVRVFLFLFSFLCITCIKSQSLHSISTKDGLPQSFVSGLVQDDSSFIWIGTRNGIARYDGIQYKVFQHNPKDPFSPASNLVIWMKKDNRNRIWVEYETGEVDVIDPVTERISHFLKRGAPGVGKDQFVRRGWTPDSGDVLWAIVKSAGLKIYNDKEGTETHFTRSNSNLPGDTVRGLTESADKKVWIVTDQSISWFDRNGKRFVNTMVPYKQDYGDFVNSDAVAIDLHERQNGELMWGDRKSLFFFHPKTKSFRTVAVPELSYLGVRWIRTGHDGAEYFENYGNLYKYDDDAGLTQIGKSIKTNFGDAKSFLVDRSGLLWIGTNAKGIQLVDLHSPFFNAFSYRKDFVTDILQQEFNTGFAGNFNWTAQDNVFSQPSYHLRSAYDKSRNLYVALKETVCYYDHTQKKIIKLPHVPVVQGIDESGIGIKGITTAADGSPIVVGYSGNILIYRAAAQRWEPLIDTGLLRKQFGATFLPQDILADDTDVWITTADDGLIKINISTKEIRQLKVGGPSGLPADQLLGLRQDRHQPHLMWIGGYQGLICFNKKTQKCEVFSIKDGLPDNTIYSILSDTSGTLWLSTNKGICEFDPATHIARTYRTQHGLPGDEFNRFHHLELPDGRLAFGGTVGWALFNPQMMRADAFDPIVAFTDLKVNNKDIAGTKDSVVLKTPLNSLKVLDLSYDQNTVTIGFAGLEYNQPEDLRYRYKLEGYDNDWVMAGGLRQAVYTKIPPGKYTLLVNASNTSGKWSKNVKVLQIHIHPPWWATGLAYLCYSIIIAGLVWAFIRFRVTQMVMKKEVVLREKEASQLKEMDEIKSRFFSNITHEFRTPLTLILGPVEQLKSAASGDTRQERLANTIESNAKQLLVLINRLMELSKLEAKALKLYEQRGSPGNIVGSIIHSFEAESQAKHVHLVYKDATGNLDGWFYADALERVVYNLVSNALKFTGVEGEIEVVLSVEAGTLLLKVADNGVGIAKEKLPYIFDRFYQADEQTATPDGEMDTGTGIGLSLVKEIVHQLNGRIEVESSQSTLKHGTTFMVWLPFRTNVGEAIEQVVAAEAEEVIAENDNGQTEQKKQVLVVEDNNELADFIHGILSDKYQVFHARNGAEGSEQALLSMPDLIISDIMMPVMDGYEFCSRIKADMRTSHIPVILLTAKTAHENLIEGLTKGADDYLTKPFHPTELQLRMQNLLNRQQKLMEHIRRDLSQPAGLSIVKEEVQDIFLTKLYELIDEHLDDSLFGVDQLAEILSISRSSLHRKLKSLTGMSTTEVVRNYRLKKATTFLREGFNSSETAYKSGFGSPAYFTKCFREVYGMTPGDFVKQAKS